MSNSFPKGSEWRKWDLHLHTPSSFDYHDKSVTNNNIIETLSNSGISVAAITDHHIIDVDKIKELQALGVSKNIIILPGIELRSELGGSDSVHFIGIFPENSKIDEIWTDIQSKCKLKPSQIAKTGDEKLYVDFRETAQLIHTLGGIVSVHAGSKTNTIENITNALPYKMAIKTELVEFIDVYEIGKEEDLKSYIENVFPNIRKILPMIICSDNHDIKSYDTKQNLWIKSNPNFEGLKQIIYEPSTRIKIQKEHPNTKRNYEIIDSVRFIDNQKKIFSNDWIELNPGLNSIIGGKSSGKSLLLYHIAKTIDADKTRETINNGASSIRYDYNFNPEITFEVKWGDGTIYNLTDASLKRDRIITFIPQLYLNALAENRTQNTDFHRIIEEILTNDETYKKFLSSKRNAITVKKSEIHSEASNYLSLLGKYKEESENLRKLGDKKAISKSLKELEETLVKLKEDSAFSADEEKEYNSLIKEQGATKDKAKSLLIDKGLINKIDEAISSLSQVTYPKLLEDRFNIIRSGYLANEDCIKKIDTIIAKLKDGISKAIDVVQQESQEELPYIEDMLKLCQGDLVTIEKDLIPFSEKFKNRDKYTLTIKLIEEEKVKISAIEQKEKELEVIKNKLKATKIILLYGEMLDLYLDIITENENRKDVDKENDITLVTEIQFDNQRFTENFSRTISKKSSLKTQFGDMFDEENTIIFDQTKHKENIEKIFFMLVDEKSAIQFNRGTSIDDVIHSLIDDYIFLEYDLKQKGDRLLEMSPGKRGIILFQLFLHLSNSSTPILIDQPEDNLDNRTVYKELNQFIIDKKDLRQIIIVSHNANLVVSTDSEEIIVANQQGQNKDAENKEFRFEYVSGALEDTFEKKSAQGILFKKGIREHVCEILEGGVDAFKKREQQYHNIS